MFIDQNFFKQLLLEIELADVEFEQETVNIFFFKYDSPTYGCSKL